MKLSVRKEEFENALIKVSCALGEKNEDIITKNFGIKADKKQVRVCANSQKVSAEYIIPSGDDLSISEEGVAVIDGASIMSNVSNFHAGVMIDIKTIIAEDKEVDEDSDDDDDDDDKGDAQIVAKGTLCIEYKTQDGELWSHEHSLLSEEYFPSADFNWSSKHNISYPASRFIDNVNKTVFAASSDSNYRADYSVLLMAFEEGGVVFFATDGCQLAYVKDLQAKSGTEKFALLKPNVVSKIAKKRILDSTENLEISIKENKKKDVPSQVRINQGGLSIISNFADANRLPFEKILSSPGDKCKFSIRAGLLTDGLRAFSDLEDKYSVWDFGEKKIVIENSSNCKRKSSGGISGVTGFQGSGCKMNFDTRYWNNILSKCDGDTEISILIRSAGAPIELSISDVPLVYKFFIMPIRDLDRKSAEDLKPVLQTKL